MNPSQRIATLFYRYNNRQATPQEVEELINLLKDGQLDDALKDQMLELWKETEEQQPDQQVDWNEMYRKIRTSQSMGQRRSPAILRRWKLTAAAAILVLLGGASIYYFNTTKHLSGIDAKHIVQTTDSTPSASPDSKQTIHLPDGSTVVLNEGSQLRYPPQFSSRIREVYLKGEAFFDIKTDKARPFLVHTEKITTTVLGTSFNIKAYQEEDTIAVTVITGKVSVSEKKKSLGLLSANQQIRYSKRSTGYVQVEVKPAPFIAWKPEDIRIENKTMEEAMEQIAAQYNLQIVFSNPAIRKCRLTASFSQDDPLEEILKVVCGVTHAQYSLQNNTITISGNGCN